MRVSAGNLRAGDSKWTLVHRYIGLFLGTWVFAVGVTGAVLAYYREIDVFLNPDLFTAVGSPRNPDLDAMVTSVQRQYPDRFILYFERYFLSPDETYPFLLSEPLPARADGVDLAALTELGAEPDLQVFVDPRTQEVVGARPYLTWIQTLREFHRELLMPSGGRKFLGALGMLLFLACVAGAVIWWRKRLVRARRRPVVATGTPLPAQFVPNRLRD